MMSNLAPSWVLADAPERCSPVMNCMCGSVQTSLHTSDNTFAVRCLISLCLIDGKSSFGQDMACSTENCEPQSQWMGVRDGIHPYHKHRASRNVLLCRVNPNSAIGRAVSQLDTPFSWASSIDRCSELSSDGFRMQAESCCRDRLKL